MPIDVLSDDLKTLDEVSPCIPGRPHRHTIYRWSLYPRHGHRLETVKVNGRMYTTIAAVREYLEAIQPGSRPESQPPSRRPKAKQRAKRARKRLAKSGI